MFSDFGVESNISDRAIAYQMARLVCRSSTISVISGCSSFACLAGWHALQFRGNILCGFALQQ